MLRLHSAVLLLGPCHLLFVESMTEIQAKSIEKQLRDIVKLGTIYVLIHSKNRNSLFHGTVLYQSRN